MTEEFPPTARIRNKTNYSFVFSAPEHVFKNMPFQVLARSNFEKTSRLGLVIPKKQIKLAVHRNRVKRLLREHFRKIILPDTTDVVILLKRRITPEDLKSHVVHEQINELFSRLARYISYSQKK